MRLGRDGIAGLIGIAVSLLLLPYAYGLPKLPIVPIGPGFYPGLVLTFLGAMSALLVLQDIVAQRRPAVSDDVARPRAVYALVAAAFAVVAGYVVLMRLVGFRLSTALFVAAFQLLLDRPAGPRQWLVLIAIALGTSALTYVVFDQYLTVLLPRGTWTGW